MAEKIGKLRKRLKLLALSNDPDGSVGLVESFSTVGTVWGKLEAVSGSRKLYGRNIDSNSTHVATIRFRDGVTSENWIEYLGGRYRIRGVTDAFEASHRFLILELEYSADEGVYDGA